MKPKIWVVDTWVLYRAAELSFDAQELLLNILARHSLAFDDRGHIEDEYLRCMRRTEREVGTRAGSRFIKQWFDKLAERKKRYFYSGQLQARHRRALERLRFDSSDMPFVAVCYRTPDKLLVSEDSDYNEAVKEYLNEEMGIQVLTIAEALSQT